MNIQENLSWKWQGGEKPLLALFDINNTVLWFHHLQALQTIHMITNPITDNGKQLVTSKFYSSKKQIDCKELLQYIVIRMKLLNLWFHPVIKFVVSSCDRMGFIWLQKSNNHKTFITDHIHRYRTLQKDAYWWHERIMTNKCCILSVRLS